MGCSTWKRPGRVAFWAWRVQAAKRSRAAMRMVNALDDITSSTGKRHVPYLVMPFDQAAYDLRCEWGFEGLRALQSASDAVVIVDVLSFSTAVDVALSQGASVLPYRRKDNSANRFAIEKGAVLAGGRSAGSEYTLSPASLRSIPPGTRLVLPSPNGSTLAFSASGVPVFTACLRNAPAVAKQAAAHGSRIAVIPAGEQWRDCSLRPCLEDLIGAGSVLAELPWNNVAGSRNGNRGFCTLSPRSEVRAVPVWFGQGAGGNGIRVRRGIGGGVCCQRCDAKADARSIRRLFDSAS